MRAATGCWQGRSVRRRRLPPTPPCRHRPGVHPRPWRGQPRRPGPSCVRRREQGRVCRGSCRRPPGEGILDGPRATAPDRFPRESLRWRPARSPRVMPRGGCGRRNRAGVGAPMPVGAITVPGRLVFQKNRLRGTFDPGAGTGDGAASRKQVKPGLRAPECSTAARPQVLRRTFCLGGDAGWMPLPRMNWYPACEMADSSALPASW